MFVNQWWGCYSQPFDHRYGVKVVEQPAQEFVDVAEARAHLRADDTAGDEDVINSQIAAARQWCEGYLGRALARQTLEMGMRRFPGTWHNGAIFTGFGYKPSWIELPNGPVRGIISVSYASDETNVNTYTDIDSSAYILDDYAEPARVYLAPAQSWPTAIDVPNAVKIRYEAGYDLPSDSPMELPLPPLARQAMLLMLGHFYENRETEIVTEGRAVAIELPTGARALLDMVPGGRLRSAVA